MQSYMLILCRMHRLIQQTVFLGTRGSCCSCGLTWQNVMFSLWSLRKICVDGSGNYHLRNWRLGSLNKTLLATLIIHTSKMYQNVTWIHHKTALGSSRSLPLQNVCDFKPLNCCGRAKHPEHGEKVRNTSLQVLHIQYNIIICYNIL